jgi:hypothetical protein
VNPHQLRFSVTGANRADIERKATEIIDAYSSATRRSPSFNVRAIILDTSTPGHPHQGILGGFDADVVVEFEATL